ncbi:chitinase 7 isoform X2 [Dermatophagoides pteronyssinus]|uniref:Probable chitinase 10 n=2 Tax=Dermatophagoides pteronyssinus TaxID=6956 RepID=A0A6P6YHS1_DERPT|nr:probable chitinase 10 [Dermatophagoides pteronyssinus]
MAIIMTFVQRFHLFTIIFLYFGLISLSQSRRLYQPRVSNQLLSSSSTLMKENVQSSNIPNKRLVCYYTNWSQYRPKEGKFVPEDIDPFLCTHIIFSFGWMKANKLTSFDSTDETLNNKKGTYERVVELKKKNPNLKVLLAVGGWSFGTERFRTMASTRYNRQVFIFSALDYLRQRNFDGLDIDWEFPKGSDDKRNFVDLLKELRIAFESEAIEKSLPRLLLTVAVSAGAEAIKNGYDVPGVANNVDFINIMSYDFHGKWEPKTGHNAPLYALSTESDWRKQLTMEYGVKMWEKLGAPKDKLIVGLATYGRSFTLSSTGNNGFNAPSSGGGKAGEYTRESGFLAFYEICEMLKNGAKYIWDEEQKVPYAIQGDQWVGFDDERSIREKLRWVIDNGYGGAMVWTVDMDDFKGTCAGIKYPLIGIMGEELLGRPKQKSKFDSIIQKAMIVDPSTKVFVPSTDINMIIDKPKVMPTAPTINKPVKNGNDTNARVVCYFTNWSHKRPGQGQFTPEHLDPFLCTHVIYAFANLNSEFKLIPSEPNDEIANGLYERVLSLKSKNPKLKILIAVGGWMMGPIPFRTLTESAYRQTLFTFNVVEFLRKRGFDGLDLCWEFPRGIEDKERYTKLLKELRETFDGEAKGSNKQRLLLSAAVPASFEAVNSGYDVPEVNKYLDFINIMTYDFHGDWEKNVAHNSPLFPIQAASDYQRKLTVDFSVNEWINKGASREKIVVGLPTYGRSFTLASPNLTDIGDPAIKGGLPGMYTKESGFLSFFEICDMLKMGATLVWDNEQMVPYAFLGDQWVGFDDPRSFKVKTQWLKQAGLSGIMIWSIDMDDFSGSCMGQKFPLINAAKNDLKGYYVENLDEITANTLSTQSENKDEVKCDEADGHISYHKDKNDCTMYFMCEGTRRHHMPCPQNLVFNIKENVCDWPENVEECATALLGNGDNNKST